MTGGVLGVYDCELGAADVAVGVLDVFADVVVHLLAHLCGIIDLVLEYL